VCACVCVCVCVCVDISIYKQQRYKCIYGLMTTPTASFSTLLVPPTVLSYYHGIYAAPQKFTRRSKRHCTQPKRQIEIQILQSDKWYNEYANNPGDIYKYIYTHRYTCVNKYMYICMYVHVYIYCNRNIYVNIYRYLYHSVQTVYTTYT